MVLLLQQAFLLYLSIKARIVLFLKYFSNIQ